MLCATTENIYFILQNTLQLYYAECPGMGEVGRTEDTLVYVVAQLFPVEFSCFKNLGP